MSNKLTDEFIKSKIQHVEYMCPPYDSTLTLAIFTMENGFIVVGKSVCVNPADFKKELGERFAYEDALRQAYDFEAYLVKQDLFMNPLVESKKVEVA